MEAGTIFIIILGIPLFIIFWVICRAMIKEGTIKTDTPFLFGLRKND